MDSHINANSFFIIIAFVFGISSCSESPSKPNSTTWQEVVGADIKENYKGLKVQLSAYAALEGDAQGLFGLCESTLNGETPENWSKYAESWCISAAEKSYPESAKFLADQYAASIFGEDKASEAKKWFEQAKQDEIIAEVMKSRRQYFIELWGGFWIEREGKEPVRRENASYLSALEKITKHAEDGDIEAMLFLASKYYNGHGVEQSNERYFEWINKAAQNGSAAAANMLGRWYLYGDVDYRDRKKAQYWFERSIELGLGRYDAMHTNPVRFVRQLRAEETWKAANNINDETVFSSLKMVGVDGPQKDKKLICEVATQINDLPHRDFYFCNTQYVHPPLERLRFSRSHSLDTMKMFASKSFYSDEVAGKWLSQVTKQFEKSAVAGNPDYADALIFECNGELSCIEKWEDIAIGGFKKRAEKGDRQAMFRLAAIFSGRYISQTVGNGINSIPPHRVDKSNSKKWLKLAINEYLDAAEDGDPEAQFAAGFLNENGIGVKKDKIKARKWYSKFLSSDSPERYNYFHLSGGHSSIFNDLREACHLEGETIDMFPVMTGNKHYPNLSKLECSLN